MSALDYLADRTDPRVISALTRKCTICAAKPDQDCVNPVGQPLNRIVHQYRCDPA